jgi:hypothetical protein
VQALAALENWVAFYRTNAPIVVVEAKNLLRNARATEVSSLICHRFNTLSEPVALRRAIHAHLQKATASGLQESDFLPALWLKATQARR